MKLLKGIVITVLGLSMTMLGGQSFCDTISKWDDVIQSTAPVNIYVGDIANKTDDKKVNAKEVTEIVKKMFADRKDPRFNVVISAESADIIFEGTISD